MKDNKKTHSESGTAVDTENLEQDIDEIRELDEATKRQLEATIARWAAERGLS